MRSYLYILLVPLLAGSSGAGLHAQEAQVGVTVPVTITGGFLDTDRPKADVPSATSLYPGFRVLAKPQMKLGSHWYFYSAIQVRSTAFLLRGCLQRRSRDRYTGAAALHGLRALVDPYVGRCQDR